MRSVCGGHFHSPALGQLPAQLGFETPVACFRVTDIKEIHISENDIGFIHIKQGQMCRNKRSFISPANLQAVNLFSLQFGDHLIALQSVQVSDFRCAKAVADLQVKALRLCPPVTEAELGRQAGKAVIAVGRS